MVKRRRSTRKRFRKQRGGNIVDLTVPAFKTNVTSTRGALLASNNAQKVINQQLVDNAKALTGGRRRRKRRIQRGGNLITVVQPSSTGSPINSISSSITQTLLNSRAQAEFDADVSKTGGRRRRRRTRRRSRKKRKRRKSRRSRRKRKKRTHRRRRR